MSEIKVASPDTVKTKELLDRFTIEELLEIDDHLGQSEDVFLDETIEKEYPFIQEMMEQLEDGEEIQEVIRAAIHQKVKGAYNIQTVFSERNTYELAEAKKKELYEVMDNLHEHLEGKNSEEVTAFFASMQEIISQICLQQTAGVVVVKTRLESFFNTPKPKKTLPDQFKQDVSLIFSPEEITAMHLNLMNLKEDDPFKELMVTILDQAYDTVKFNELSGHLLIMMTHYFLKKLQLQGLSDHTKFIEFTRMYKRNKDSFEKALEELEEMEAVIDKHLDSNPVLNEYPKYLRALLQIKIGLIEEEFTPKLLQSVQSRSDEYARARRAAAFDFDKFPEFQHELVYRNGYILSMQKKVLDFTVEQLEEEFKTVKHELERLLDDIESASEQLDPHSPEYQAKLKKKAELQRKMEQSRRRIDVVRGQMKLVDVQYQFAKKAIQRIKEQTGKIDPTLEIPSQQKIDTTPASATFSKRKTHRMFMAKRIRKK